MLNRTPLKTLIGASLAATLTTTAFADTYLYTSSNESTGNSVLEIVQDDDGFLAIVAEYDTGGTGTDGGLGNQGAIALDDEFLFVVNAGSDSISSFRIGRDGNLELVDQLEGLPDRATGLVSR